MCRKIRCDRESCKVLGFLVYLNRTQVHIFEKVMFVSVIMSDASTTGFLRYHRLRSCLVQKNSDFATVALSFLFDKYCPIIN